MNRKMTKICTLWIAVTFTAGLMAAAVPDPNNPTGTSGVIMIDKRGGLVRFFDPTTLKEISSLRSEGAENDRTCSNAEGHTGNHGLSGRHAGHRD
jgi:hypothetical protein